jgi:hypothetical protein
MRAVLALVGLLFGAAAGFMALAASSGLGRATTVWQEIACRQHATFAAVVALIGAVFFCAACVIEALKEEK